MGLTKFSFFPAIVPKEIVAGIFEFGTNAVIEVSLTVTDAVLLCAVTVNVSAPSVRLSATMPTLMVAVPLELTVAEPVSRPPVMSAALIPDRV